jgi:predicted Zn-dependent protease
MPRTPQSSFNRTRRPWECWLLLMVFGLFVVSCATTGPGGKKSLILVSDQEEMDLGKSVAEEVLKEETPLPDSVWQDYLASVGEKIVKVSDRSTLPFHFTVLENDQVNAFATPGGYLFFYTGILRLMDSEDELAAVMAHEVSHVVARHSIKTIQAYYGGAIALNLILGEKSKDFVGQVTGLVFNLALQGYGRSNENEADEYGLLYMKNAGYNPEAMVTMFDKLASLSGGKDRGWFENLTASHPETKDRIAHIKQLIASYPPDVTQRPIKKSRYEQMKARLPAPKEEKP